MQLNTIPIHYKHWFNSPLADSFRWMFPTIGSVGYFLRTRRDTLVSAGLIIFIPNRGYFILVDKFTEEAIKPYFVLGNHSDFDLSTSKNMEII